MILIIGGLYEGLGLGCALTIAKQNREVVILHSLATSRPQDEVQKLYNRLRLEVPTLEICRYQGINELEEYLIKYSTFCTGVVIANGQRAYDFTSSKDLDPSDILAAIEREIATSQLVVKYIFPRWIEKKQGALVSFGYYRDYWNNHLPLNGGHLFSNDSCLFKIAKACKYELYRTLADQHVVYNIRINIIEPGRIENLPLDKLLAVLGEKLDLSRATSLNVAKLCSFLLSDESQYVTGAIIPVLNKPITYKLPNSNDRNKMIVGLT